MHNALESGPIATTTTTTHPKKNENTEAFPYI
jgi:hypothetical protein